MSTTTIAGTTVDVDAEGFLTDPAQWNEQIAAEIAHKNGIEALTATAIQGKGAMPPKGGSSASDADIKAVVTYMVSAAK